MMVNIPVHSLLEDHFYNILNKDVFLLNSLIRKIKTQNSR